MCAIDELPLVSNLFEPLNLIRPHLLVIDEGTISKTDTENIQLIKSLRTKRAREERTEHAKCSAPSKAQLSSGLEWLVASFSLRALCQCLLGW